MSDFKKIRNILFYNGFKITTSGDMSSMMVELDGDEEVVFKFGAGGDVLTEIHPFQDSTGDTESSYNDGYDDAQYEHGEEVDAAYEEGRSAGFDKGFEEGRASE